MKCQNDEGGRFSARVNNNEPAEQKLIVSQEERSSQMRWKWMRMMRIPQTSRCAQKPRCVFVGEW